MIINETYENKIDACLKAIDALGCDPKELIDAYGSQPFPDCGIQKKRCFGGVLKKRIPQDCLDYMNDKCNLTYFRDAREPYEYGIDLILGWLVEDAVLRVVINQGGVALLSGHDRYREFLSARKISTQPDIRIGTGNSSRLLEIMMDLKGTWRKQGHIDLRDKKYEKLVAEKALMFGIAPLSTEGFVEDFSRVGGDWKHGFIPAYRKEGYTDKTVRGRLQSLGEAVSALEAFCN